MATLVYLSRLERAVSPEEATVSVFDRGFLYGDGVFETLRTAGGLGFYEAEHLARLRRSAGGIGLSVPWSDEELSARVQETHRQSGNPESYVRIIVTRGEGVMMLDPRASMDPTLVIIVRELKLPAPAEYDRGIKACVVNLKKTDDGLLDPSIKSGNYLANIQALRAAIDRGADDAILCNAAGEVAEGATSNVFAVIEGVLVTPPLQTGLLPGITRQIVWGLAGQLGMERQERAVRPAELQNATEIFLTSSVRGIMPVTQLDGRTIGSGTRGAVARKLGQAYDAHLGG